MSVWQNILAITAIIRYVRTCPSGNAGTTPAQCTLALMTQRRPNLIHKYNGLIITVSVIHSANITHCSTQIIQLHSKTIITVTTG